MIGDTTLTTHRMKYSAAYSMGREFIEKCYCVTRTVSEGSDPLKLTRFLFLNLNPMQGIGSSLYSELGHAQYNFEERLVFAG